MITCDNSLHHIQGGCWFLKKPQLSEHGSPCPVQRHLIGSKPPRTKGLCALDHFQTAAFPCWISMSFLPSCSEDKDWLLSPGSDAREEISAVTVPAGDRTEISLCTAAVRESLCNVVSRSFCISCSKMSSTKSSVKIAKCPHGKARITRHLQLLYLFQINTDYLPSKPSPCKQTMVWHWGGHGLLWHHAVLGLVRQGCLPE